MSKFLTNSATFHRKIGSIPALALVYVIMTRGQISHKLWRDTQFGIRLSISDRVIETGAISLRSTSPITLTDPIGRCLVWLWVNVHV